MQTITFDCLKCIQPIGEFYVGVMNHEDLIFITYADIRRLESGGEKRDVEIYTGIQRELSPNRTREIGKYVNMVDATFPTSVILHINPEDIIAHDAISGKMTIPYRDSIAKVLDGQHRIAGLGEYRKADSSFQINITIFVGMELEDQAIVFATINKTQTKVNKSLVADLFDFAIHRSPQKTSHNVARALNQKEGSPFKDKIKILGNAADKEKETITQATFSEALLKLITADAMSDRDVFKRGRTPSRVEGKELQDRPLRNLFIDGADAMIAKIIWEFFSAVSQRWPDAWNQNRKEMILNKSTGFIALMRLFKDLYLMAGEIGVVIDREYYLNYFKNSTLTDDDFNRTLFIPGSGGQSKLYAELKDQLGLN